MKEIKLNGKIVAIFHKQADWKKDLHFLTPGEAFIQSGTWWYPKGKELKAHTHIKNERFIDQTQETVVVLSGRLRVDLYDDEKKIFHQEELSAGDIGIVLDVCHGFHILENDSKIVEVKNGPFISVEKDKKELS